MGMVDFSLTVSIYMENTLYGKHVIWKTYELMENYTRMKIDALTITKAAVWNSVFAIAAANVPKTHTPKESNILHRLA